jgi:DNA helicase-2/ATP-dependent DNA helicase PcrA
MDLSQQIQIATTAWHAPLTTMPGDLRDALATTLDQYQISATHLNNFVDVPHSGPEAWLLNNLLKFPQARSAAAEFGTAVHTALQRAQTFRLSNHATKPLEDVLADFAEVLRGGNLSATDLKLYLGKGRDALAAWYPEHATTFTDTGRAEVSLSAVWNSENPTRLTGMIDRLDVDAGHKTLRLTDYKTGKAPRDWAGQTDYEKIKLRKYRQQLLFYKLLLENSREFAGWTVASGTLDFIEPSRSGQTVSLSLDYANLDAETHEFQSLLRAVWRRMTTLDLPDADQMAQFSPDFKGMVAFEQWLRETDG